MNKFEDKFAQVSLKRVRDIDELICVNFENIDDGSFYSGEDNGYFVILLDKTYRNIRIKHNLSGNINGLRFKMYYAQRPENAFCEEQSCELGFFDSVDYDKVIRLGKQGFDAFRFDFGFAPIQFQINDFELEEVADKELSVQRRKEKRESVRKTLKYIGYNLWHWKRALKEVKKNGIKYQIIRVSRKIKSGMKEELNAKTTQQVIEPYRVAIKQPIKQNRQKVLNIIENFYTGGSSRLIIDNIEYYGHEYEHKVFTMAYRGEEEFLDIDVEVIDIEQKEEVIQKIREFAPDIIHVHIWEGEWYHRVFDLLESVKDIQIIENINTPLAPIVRDFIDKYVFVSRYVIDNFADASNPKNCVIYPGSNFDMFTREAEEGYLAKDTIGMVYRLGYDKLNQRSIDVFIKTVQKRRNTKAIIVGGGSQYDYYVDKVKQAGVSQNFLFTGYVPYIDLPKWYEKFTVFVAPVWKESFGQVSPFAMSMGMPVAGYNIGALNEIIDDSSLLAASEDSDQLSDILVGLLDDYGRCVKIGKRNQSRAHELFGVQQMVDDYYKLYNELLEAKDNG